MIISQQLLSQINEVQVEILADVIEVCDKLNLRYFMVHGSLLGTILKSGFMPFDDDIDIAMPRADYNVFITEAQRHLKDYYFIQSNQSEEMYPLAFAKVRDSRTTYIIEKMKHLKLNQGVYIDIFPIDYYETVGIKRKIRQIKAKILDIRIGCVYQLNDLSEMQKLRRIVSRIIYPSWEKAVKCRESLSQIEPKAKRVKLTGGKESERGIPSEWFSDFVTKKFEGLEIKVPKDYDKYLGAIYGDYNHFDVAKANKVSENEVEVNACAIDLSKPPSNGSC